MASSPQDRAVFQAWLKASEPFLLQEGDGLTTLAVLDLLDAGRFLGFAPVSYGSVSLRACR